MLRLQKLANEAGNIKTSSLKQTPKDMQNLWNGIILTKNNKRDNRISCSIRENTSISRWKW